MACWVCGPKDSWAYRPVSPEKLDNRGISPMDRRRPSAGRPRFWPPDLQYNRGICQQIFAGCNRGICQQIFESKVCAPALGPPSLFISSMMVRSSANAKLLNGSRSLIPRCLGSGDYLEIFPLEQTKRDRLPTDMQIDCWYINVYNY